MVRQLTQIITLSLLTTITWATPKSFMANYDVYEDGEVKASLTTQFKQINGENYRLTDTTTGTAGLASLLNFKRTEQTDFQYRNGQAEVSSHSMQQKVAFKSKHFEFNHPIGNSEYQGIDNKTPFKLTSEQPLLSTHLLSWQLAQHVCHTPQKPMSWPVLKSPQTKNYNFRLIAVDNDRSLVHREYDNRPDTSTAIWINHQGCYIEEIIYNKDGQIVRTVLKHIKFD